MNYYQTIKSKSWKAFIIVSEVSGNLEGDLQTQNKFNASAHYVYEPGDTSQKY